MQHVQHAGALAGAEVHGLDALMLHDVFQSADVTLCKVNNVDVVSYAGAVGGVVVISENTEELSLAHSHLLDVGEEVVGYAVGILAYKAAAVSADRIEISKQSDAPFPVGNCHIPEYLLDHHLGIAVGVGGGVGRHGLNIGDWVIHAVNGGRGGENYPLAAVGAHSLDKHQ